MSDSDGEKDTHLTFGLLQSGDHLIGVSTEDLAEVVPILKLTPYPSEDPAVLGAISVRGVLVPVLDPMALCGLQPGARPPQVAALLRNDRNLVALAMDQVVELRRVAPHELQAIDNAAEDALVTVFLLTEAGQVNILGTKALFARPALPLANRHLRVKEEQGNRNVRPHLTFESGGVRYAIAVSNLFNTIPRRTLESTDVASGAFLGKVTYHRRTIPVVDMNALVNMTAARETDLPEIVVVHIGNDRLLGLAVDRISRIEYFQVSEIVAVPDHLRAAMPLVRATFQQKDTASHTLIIDPDEISALPEMAGVTEMSDKEGDTPPTEEPVKTDREDIERVRNRNLVFSAGSEFAVPVQEIFDVLPPPKEITPWQSGIPGLQGLFFFRNRMTPLIHLTRYLGNSSADTVSEKYVLVCGTPDLAVGFLVDGIRGILQSDWQTTSKLETGFDMVHIVDRGKSWLCPRVPLEALAADVTRNLSEPLRDAS
jgi:chemotaxis signal transduction protein